MTFRGKGVFGGDGRLRRLLLAAHVVCPLKIKRWLLAAILTGLVDRGEGELRGWWGEGGWVGGWWGEGRVRVRLGCG